MNPKPKPAAGDLVRQPMTQLSSQTPVAERDEMRLAHKEFVETTTHASIGAELVSASAGWAAWPPLRSPRGRWHSSFGRPP
jgi:hypothetical protein